MNQPDQASNRPLSSVPTRSPVEVVHPAPDSAPVDQSLENAIGLVRKQAEHFAEESLPKSLGPFEIRGRLGEGTYGVVFEAEQVEPIRRSVALKILKSGWLGGEVLSRFERERHLLGAMRHPGIASIYDAGVTEDRRPWFAMELVRGMPITEYCRVQQLPLKACLDLLEKVCWAVFHAHQRLVIHRDLTPRNILVEDVDGVATPKVIDFGVSKAMTGGDFPGESTWSTELTVVGTPYYMSPEQAQGSKGVDVRTDVYALGAILFEIVTGKKLFDASAMQDGSVQAMMYAVRNSNPSEFRYETINQSIRKDVSRRFVKELWWVTRKAIEKEADRRYAGIDRLAQDLRALLDNRPVTAGPDSAAYRLRKGAQRHKWALAFGCASLVAIGSVTMMLAHSARVSRQQLVQTESVRLERAHSRGDWKELLAAYQSIESFGHQPGLAERLMFIEALDASDRSDEAFQHLQQIMADPSAGADPRVLLWKGDLLIAQGLRGGLRQEALQCIQGAVDTRGSSLSKADREYALGLLAQQWSAAHHHFQNACQLRPSHRRASMMAVVSSTMCGDAAECRKAIDRWRLLSDSDWQVRAAEVLYCTFFASKDELKKASEELLVVRSNPSVVKVCSVAADVHTAWHAPVNPIQIESTMAPAIMKLLSAGFGMLRSPESGEIGIRTPTALSKSVDSLSVPLLRQATLNPVPAIEKITDGVPLFKQLNSYLNAMALFSKSKDAKTSDLQETARLLDQADAAKSMPALSCAIAYCRLFVGSALRKQSAPDPTLSDKRIEELFSQVLEFWSIEAEGVIYLRDSLDRLGRRDLVERLAVFLQRRDPQDAAGWTMQLATLIGRGAVVDAVLAVDRAAGSLPADSMNGLVDMIGLVQLSEKQLAAPAPGKAGRTLREVLSQNPHERVRALAAPAIEIK